VRELLQPSRVAEVGILDEGSLRRVSEKFETTGGRRVSETDEMALVGSLSIQVLHHRLVAEPALAAPLEPNRVVVGAQEQVRQAA
jgi:hypothetical protein